MKRICILLLAAAVLLSCTFPALAEEEISQQAAYEQGQKLLAEGQYAGRGLPVFRHGALSGQHGILFLRLRPPL